MTPKNDSNNFGANLKKLRIRKKMSLEELASGSGLGKSYLAGVEDGDVLPAVGVVIRLAEALAVDLSTFMDMNAPKIVPRKRKEAVAVRTRDYSYENLTAEERGNRLMAFRITIPPKSAHRRVAYRHDGEEFIYVLSGRLKITIGKKTKVLERDESVHFDSGKPHHLHNPGDKPTRLIVAIFTP